MKPEVWSANDFPGFQGAARRKNCCAPEMIFVTVYCPLTMTGATELPAQPAGDPKFVVDCKVTPVIFVGQVKTIQFDDPERNPAGLTVSAGTGSPDTNTG